MYMPGRLQTASRPSSTVIDAAPYSAGLLADSAPATGVSMVEISAPESPFSRAFAAGEMTSFFNTQTHVPPTGMSAVKCSEVLWKHLRETGDSDAKCHARSHGRSEGRSKGRQSGPVREDARGLWGVNSPGCPA